MYISTMTLDDLKNALQGKTFSNNIQINPDTTVVDATLFLRVQFIECDNWKKEIEKCPAYVRLVRFYNAINTIENEKSPLD